MAARAWVRNADASADECYVLGSIVGEPDPSSGDLVVALDGGREVTVHASEVCAANPEGLSCLDNTMLMKHGRLAIPAEGVSSPRAAAAMKFVAAFQVHCFRL